MCATTVRLVQTQRCSAVCVSVTRARVLQEAKAAGATAMFGEKYDDVVRVVDVPGVSMELCGGTHVRNTSEIGVFKVVSESGIASGIRRVEAVCGEAALEYLGGLESVVRQLSGALKVSCGCGSLKVTCMHVRPWVGG